LAKNPSDLPDEIFSEANIVSFVVRVWKEEAAAEGEGEIWRGHITPIPDGTRHYFTNFDDLKPFILEYLKSSGEQKK
jgi:hypothetical protein